ncbi:hypothetical protein FB451DRAFT_1229978 [Mycena latifolia]|nr:hypothetical protein FB451DRAFT_1229978 [Mycena latifolia]
MVVFSFSCAAQELPYHTQRIRAPPPQAQALPFANDDAQDEDSDDAQDGDADDDDDDDGPQQEDDPVDEGPQEDDEGGLGVGAGPPRPAGGIKFDDGAFSWLLLPAARQDYTRPFFHRSQYRHRQARHFPSASRHPSAHPPSYRAPCSLRVLD